MNKKALTKNLLFLFVIVVIVTAIFSAFFVFAELTAVSLVAPAASASISGTYTFNATVTGNSTNMSFYWWNETSSSWKLLCSNDTHINSTSSWCNYDTTGINDGTGYIFNATAQNDTNTTSGVSADVTVDNLGPTATLTIDPTSIRRHQSSTISCSATDTVGVASVEITVLKPDDTSETPCTGTTSCSATYTPVLVGDHDFVCTAIDNADHSGTDTGTLTVRSRSGLGVSLPPEEEEEEEEEIPSAPPSEPSEFDYDLGNLIDYEANETNVTVEVNQTITFVVKGESHTAQIEGIGEDSITIWIWSDPITTTVNLGETNYLDLDANGLEELALTLHSIAEEKATLTFYENKEITIEEPTERNLTWLWIVIGILAVIVLIIIVIGIQKSKKPKRR